MAGVLSSYFGRDLLEPGILGGEEYQASPDTMLFENTVPAPQLPTRPPPVVSTRNEPGTVPAPPGAAVPSGDAALAIGAAMGVVGRDYVWGGTFAGGGGGDCSGLLYYAFNAAGIAMPRYRAADYGHMGAPVSAQDARPGDIVYFDEPGDTDHVGLYLGNGKFVESPRPGQQVQVSQLRSGAQLRRVLPDSAFHGLPTDGTGQLQFHANNTVYTGGRVPAGHPGVQADPVEQLRAMDAAMSLDAIEGSTDVGSILASFGTASPDSIFGQASAAFSSPSPASTRVVRDRPIPAAGPGGITVGQASGLSPAEAWIITHESGGDPAADNPHSTAFGVWQGLAATRRDYAARFGYSPETTDVGEQLVMFRAYVRDRYSTAENAQRFWMENGWY